MKLSTGVRLTFSTLIFIGLVLGMQACGGGGSSAPPLTDQDASGIYTSGSLTVDPSGANTTYTDFVGMIHNNKFMLFSINGHILYEGTINSITLKDYSATVSVYRNGVNVDDNVSVTGKVTSESTFDGNLAGGNDAYSTGSFSVSYDAIYKNVPSFARIDQGDFNGVAYSTIDLSTFFSIRNTTFNLIAVVTTADPKCVYTSQQDTTTIPTADKNIYQISMVKIVDDTNCPIISSGYDGMATLINKSVNTTDDRIFLALTNGINSVFAIAER